MFSLESPHRGDSNDYTQHTIVNIKTKTPKTITNTIMSAAMGFLSHRESRMSSKYPW